MGHEEHRYRLQRLTAEIIAARLGLFTDHPRKVNPGDVTFRLSALERKIRHWDANLRLIVSDVNARQSMARLWFEQDRHGKAAYSTRNRRRSHDAIAREIGGLITLMRNALGELVSALADVPDAAAGIEGVKHAAEQQQISVNSAQDIQKVLQHKDAKTYSEVKLPGGHDTLSSNGLDSVGPLNPLLAVFGLMVMLKALVARRKSAMPAPPQTTDSAD